MKNSDESQFVTSGWSFIPGPLQFQEPFYSIELQEVATYPASSIETAILGFKGARLVQPAQPTWWSWRAQWQEDQRIISLSMSLFDKGEAIWGGSELETDCFIVDLLALWRTIRKTHPCVWLHSPAGRIYTEASLLEERCFDVNKK